MPMGRYTRYVTWEMLMVFGVTLIGVTLVMLVLVVVQEAIQQAAVSFGTILRLLPYLLPNALRFAVPATVLFAVCSVYGKMSSNNEIVALKSLGISPAVIINPALIFGFLVSLVAVWLNDLAVSWGQQGIQRVVVASVEEIAYGMLRSHLVYRTDQFSISVRRMDGKTLVDPVIEVTPNDGAEPVTIIASTAQLRFEPDAGELTISLTNCTIDYGDYRKDIASFADGDSFEKTFSLLDDLRLGSSNRRPSQYALRELPRETEAHRSRLMKIRQAYAADAGFSLLTANLKSLLSSDWKKRHAKMDFQVERLHRLQTEPYRRWANGFSCIGFILVGLPLAVRFRNADLMTTFGACFFPILIVYYPLLMLAVDRAKCGALPPYSVWLGNFVLAAVGALCWRHIVRY